jgi:probable H4MPT-linked C1 transfer pathway protein
MNEPALRRNMIAPASPPRGDPVPLSPGPVVRSSRSVVGLDIGGANLKAAHSTGMARSQPFALWKNPAGLPAALTELIRDLPYRDLLAVTMTGELCDCFETKRQGVKAILDAVAAVAGSTPVRVWRTDGRLVDVSAARVTPLQTAAANWLALATWAGRHAPAGPGLLIDIGSTTTDIVALCDGQPIPRGRIDPQRLHCRELVYTGVRRTPVCALLGASGAAEWFATALDVYLVLGDVAEDVANRDTADARPATRRAAHARLARMLCADFETCSEEETLRLARQVRARQVALLRDALDHVAATLPGPPRAIILAGSGEFLARQVLEPQLGADLISLAQVLGAGISQSACAYALAVLAAERSCEPR